MISDHLTISDNIISDNLTSDTEADEVCAACPHPWSSHDEIAVRYCTATGASGRDRGCVCANKQTG